MSFISIMNPLKEKKELLLLSNNSPPLKYNIIVSPLYNKYPNLNPMVLTTAAENNLCEVFR